MCDVSSATRYIVIQERDWVLEGIEWVLVYMKTLCFCVLLREARWSPPQAGGDCIVCLQQTYSQKGTETLSPKKSLRSSLLISHCLWAKKNVIAACFWRAKLICCCLLVHAVCEWLGGIKTMSNYESRRATQRVNIYSVYKHGMNDNDSSHFRKCCSMKPRFNASAPWQCLGIWTGRKEKFNWKR